MTRSKRMYKIRVKYANGRDPHSFRRPSSRSIRSELALLWYEFPMAKQIEIEPTAVRS